MGNSALGRWQLVTNGNMILLNGSEEKNFNIYLWSMCHFRYPQIRFASESLWCVMTKRKTIGFSRCFGSFDIIFSCFKSVSKYLNQCNFRRVWRWKYIQIQNKLKKFWIDIEFFWYQKYTQIDTDTEALKQ